MIFPSEGFVGYCRPDTPQRRLEQAKAWVGGYFWSPCPLCKETSGGHEWKARVCIPADPLRPFLGQGVCPTCEQALIDDGFEQYPGWIEYTPEEWEMAWS